MTSNIELRKGCRNNKEMQLKPYDNKKSDYLQSTSRMFYEKGKESEVDK